VFPAKTYAVVTIGTQVWMAENLNYPTSSGSACYQGVQTNCDQYGRLYDWASAKTVCPEGWRLPSKNDWATLATAVSEDNHKLKSAFGWIAVEGVTNTDDYGFNAKPAGNSTAPDSYAGLGMVAVWWSSTEENNDNAFRTSMDHTSKWIYYLYGYPKSHKSSVRCLKN